MKPPPRRVAPPPTAGQPSNPAPAPRPAPVCRPEDWPCPIDGIILPPNPAQPGPVIVISPGQAARQAAAELEFSTPEISFGPAPEINPWDGMFVGVPYWVWTEDLTPGRRIVETEQGITITMEHGAAAVDWDFGDGTTKSCGAGTPWAAQPNQPLVDSPTCGHRYQQPGSYTMTATATWTVRWSAMGQSGSFPMSRSASNGPFEVGELHSLLVEPN